MKITSLQEFLIDTFNVALAAIGTSELVRRSTLHILILVITLLSRDTLFEAAVYAVLLARVIVTELSCDHASVYIVVLLLRLVVAWRSCRRTFERPVQRPGDRLFDATRLIELSLMAYTLAQRDVALFNTRFPSCITAPALLAATLDAMWLCG